METKAGAATTEAVAAAVRTETAAVRPVNAHPASAHPVAAIPMQTPPAGAGKTPAGTGKREEDRERVDAPARI